MSYAPIYSEELLSRQPAATSTPAFSTKKQKAQNRRRPGGKGASRGVRRDFPIIVHSHLCWDWVWQRPQQFVSRLSRNHPVLFVELVAPDPELAAPMARFRKLDEFPNVTVLRLQFPSWYWNDGARVDRERRELVSQFIAGPGAGHYEQPAQWFYDPMAVPAFAGRMGEILTVYDCMDELAKFACAPPQIIERELELLERADVVFTGGRRLYESKSRFNDNCHFYGCGVDADHFGRARSEQTSIPPELLAARKPVLGYFGVIDERLDYGLIGSLADANPQWSVAMVGPVLKVDEQSLPRRANLHWLGKRSYDELPGMCRGFDLCLMPFALNAATEFINPTKALEYMATGRQIVSTPVSDVVRNFGEVVKIARSAEEFVSACRKALEEPDRDSIERGLAMARANSWDSIVSRLENHMLEALEARGKAKE